MLSLHDACPMWGGADEGPPDPRRHGVGEGDRTAVRTAGLHHQPDRLAGPDVQAAALDHVAVHRGVEIRVVLDVVDVAVDVVVHPARRDRLKMPVILASRIRCPALAVAHRPAPDGTARARKSRMASRVSFGRSEEHTSELQSLMRISYAVFCLKKKTK